MRAPRPKRHKFTNNGKQLAVALIDVVIKSLILLISLLELTSSHVIQLEAKQNKELRTKPGNRTSSQQSTGQLVGFLAKRRPDDELADQFNDVSPDADDYTDYRAFVVGGSSEQQHQTSREETLRYPAYEDELVDGPEQPASNGSQKAASGLQRQARLSYWRLVWFVLPAGATFGNLLVILAVYRERSLQSVTNYFIVSLAFADLFVGLVVMPFAVYVLVNGIWELSDTICDIFVAVDVTSSTASILNLVAISIDRYRAVAHPIAYTASSSSTIALVTIAGVWIISCSVGAPIILGLNTSPERDSHHCVLYNSTFIFWSSLTSFYIPCIAMIALYWRIFSAIKSRTKLAFRTSASNTNAGSQTRSTDQVSPKRHQQQQQQHHLYHQQQHKHRASLKVGSSNTKPSNLSNLSVRPDTGSGEPIKRLAIKQCTEPLVESHGQLTTSTRQSIRTHSQVPANGPQVKGLPSTNGPSHNAAGSSDSHAEPTNSVDEPELGGTESRPEYLTNQSTDSIAKSLLQIACGAHAKQKAYLVAVRKLHQCRCLANSSVSSPPSSSQTQACAMHSTSGSCRQRLLAKIADCKPEKLEASSAITALASVCTLLFPRRRFRYWLAGRPQDANWNLLEIEDASMAEEDGAARVLHLPAAEMDFSDIDSQRSPLSLDIHGEFHASDLLLESAHAMVLRAACTIRQSSETHQGASCTCCGANLCLPLTSPSIRPSFLAIIEPHKSLAYLKASITDSLTGHASFLIANMTEGNSMASFVIYGRHQDSEGSTLSDDNEIRLVNNARLCAQCSDACLLATATRIKDKPDDELVERTLAQKSGSESDARVECLELLRLVRDEHRRASEVAINQLPSEQMNGFNGRHDSGSASESEDSDGDQCPDHRADLSADSRNDSVSHSSSSVDYECSYDVGGSCSRSGCCANHPPSCSVCTCLDAPSTETKKTQPKIELSREPSRGPTEELKNEIEAKAEGSNLMLTATRKIKFRSLRIKHFIRGNQANFRSADNSLTEKQSQEHESGPSIEQQPGSSATDDEPQSSSTRQMASVNSGVSKQISATTCQLSQETGKMSSLDGCYESSLMVQSNSASKASPSSNHRSSAKSGDHKVTLVTQTKEKLKNQSTGSQLTRSRTGGSRRRREKNAARRERKATKTLAIVLGIFLICWTPFFTCNIIDGICIQLDTDCRPGIMVYTITSWLGYINSCVNPIIYTIFNIEFRRAFKKILTTRPTCCHGP